MKRYTLLVIFFVSLLLITPNVGFGATSAEIQSQIQAIMAQIQALQQQLVQLQAQDGGTTAWCHTFNTNLKIGDTGDEVDALASALIKERLYRPLESGIAVPGPTLFYERIASAVTGFQEKYRDEILTPIGLKYGTGYVGKSTRAKLNQLYGCGGVTKPPVSAGYLEIEPSSASIAVGGSVSMQAMYQPPMPKCPEGFACPQVMPARYPVVAEWTSSNPGVASIDVIGSCAAIGCPVPTNVLIKGISNGTAYINALYNPPYDTDKIPTAIARVTVGSVSSAPSITVLSPNGGEVWQVGSTQTIRWATKNLTLTNSNAISVALQKGGQFQRLLFTTTNDGVELWVIPTDLTAGNDYKIYIYCTPVGGAAMCESSDTSDAPFSIVAATSQPSITVTSPNGGEALIKGQSYFIRWAQTGFASDGWIQLQLRDAVNPSTMVKLIAQSIELGIPAGTLNWIVPSDIPDGKYLIWATAGSGSDALGTRVLGSDFSDAPFSIVAVSGGAAQVLTNQQYTAALTNMKATLDQMQKILENMAR